MFISLIRKPVFTGFLILLVFNCLTIFAQTGWYLSSSVQISGGSYVSETYNNLYSLYGGLRYQTENFGLSISVPVIGNHLNYSTIVNSQPLGNNQMMNSMDFGLGDLYFYTDFKLLSEASGYADLYFNTSIKFPTASSNINLSSDEFDFGFSIALKKSFNSFIVFIDAGYLYTGNPASFNYKNPFSYGIGAGKFFSYGKYSLFIYYNGYSKILDQYEPPQQISIGANYLTNSQIIFSIVAAAGIGDFTPDYTLSGGIRFRL